MKLSGALAKKLVEAAKNARKHAYCPYSHYAVGAAVLADSGRIFTGANVENGSFGLGVCAERTAVWNAVGHGARKLLAACVAAKEAHPCGACRQVLFEFSSKDTALLLVDVQGSTARIRRTTVFKTLPDPFDPFVQSFSIAAKMAPTAL